MSRQDYKTFFHVEPHSSKKDISKIGSHNTDPETRKKEKHICTELTKNNEYIIGSENDILYKQIVEHLEQREISNEEWKKKESKNYQEPKDIWLSEDKRVRKNGILCYDFIANYPGELKEVQLSDDPDAPKGFVPVDKPRYEKWKQDTINFAYEKFGKEQFLHLVLHVDETRPHFHGVFIPSYEVENNGVIEKRLNCHKYIDGPSTLRKMQTEYANTIGFERGIEKSEVTYHDMQKFKTITTKSIHAELPQVRPKQTAEQYRKEANEEYVAVRVQNDKIKEDNRKLSQKAQMLDKKERLNNELREQSQKQQKIIRELEQDNEEKEQKIKKHEQDKLALKLGLDEMRKTVSEQISVYDYLTEKAMELGKEQLIKAGVQLIPEVDKNNNGIDDGIEGFEDKNNNGVDDRYE